jgi:hypothetical protein
LGGGTRRAHLQQKDKLSNEEWGCHSTVKTLTHNCSCLKELQGEEPKGKKGPETGPKWDTARGEAIRPDTTTEDMECSRKGSIITALWKIQQQVERVKSRYLHPTKGQKLLIPVVELRKAKRSCGERWPCRRTSSLNYSGPWDISVDHQTGSIHQLIWGPKHTEQRMSKSDFIHRWCT